MTDDADPMLSADEALARLVEGNERFRTRQARWSGATPEVLASLREGQRPFATIIGCSDSRVPPELIFDAGLGELFVVRVAGNVISGEVGGSLQYAGSHLHTPLFLVLGHDGCGAVGAAIDTLAHGTRHRSRIHLLVENILSGLGDIDPRLPRDAQLALGVERNVRWSVRQIAESPEGRARLAEGAIRLVGAVYEVASGTVRLLDETPARPGAGGGRPMEGNGD
jgi:carbonic anhydrase